MVSTRHACKCTATYIRTLKLAGKVTCKSNFFKIRCYVPFHYLSLLRTKTHITCARDSNKFIRDFLWLHVFVSRHVYLTDKKTDRINWNKGNNVCVCFLAFPSLNCWCTHTESTRVLCSSRLVWCSLQITRGDHEDNVCVLYSKFSCSCIQTREFFKNT